MAVEVLETPLASAQTARLRGPAVRAYQRFLDELADRGCGALAYRVTGPTPLEYLCVKHLRGEDRVVVAFESDTRAWVLLVGSHREDDPRRNFYDQLYRLAGVSPPADQRRRKPPCCENVVHPPVLDDQAVAVLVDRATSLLREDNRRAGPRRRRRANTERRSR